MICLALVYFTQVFLFLQNPSPPQPRPDDALQTALKAIEKIDSVEYETRTERTTSTGVKFKTRTTILATRSPFRYIAKLRGEDVSVTQMAVSDGKITRASADGKTNETNTFAPSYPKEKLMPTLNNAVQDVSATWRLLLDPEFLKEAIASGDILYVKQEDIEGDLCNVVLYIRNSAVFESITEYYWFSTKTGLPRAAQRLNLGRGVATLFPRFIITKINPNPSINAENFSYIPTASDSSSVPELKLSVNPPLGKKSLIGEQLPALEARDIDFKPLNLSEFKGKPTLLNFWATWCGPCKAELPALQKLHVSYQGKLQVIAIAAHDSRLNVSKFVKDNPHFKFVFLTDPDMQESESKLSSFFGLDGLPKSVFIDAQGKITDHWFGFEGGEPALVKRIQTLMGH